jgi:hypothetical protein
MPADDFQGLDRSILKPLKQLKSAHLDNTANL